jgi:hypothetical protein
MSRCRTTGSVHPPRHHGVAWTPPRTYYYDGVPLIENNVSYPVVPVAELPPPAAKAFIAAIDPDPAERSRLTFPG